MPFKEAAIVICITLAILIGGAVLIQSLKGGKKKKPAQITSPGEIVNKQTQLKQSEKDKKGKDIPVPGKEPNTMVLDALHGRKLEYIEHPAGKMWRYNGNLLYVMKRNYVNGVALDLAVVEPPKQLDILPEKLFRALHDDDTAVWMMSDESLWEKIGTIGIWIMVIMAIVLIVVMGNKK